MRPHDGVPTLTLRIANRRTGTIFNASARLTILLRHQTMEGRQMWRVHELKLMRDTVQAMSLVWVLRHVIDDASPLHGLSGDALAASDAQLMISVTGTDGTLAAPVHAVRAYEPGDILWSSRFADVMTVDASGRTRVELARLNDVLPADPATPGLNRVGRG